MLAGAGFFCGYYGGARADAGKNGAWVKCHACRAHLFQWPHGQDRNLAEHLARGRGLPDSGPAAGRETPGPNAQAQLIRRPGVPLVSHYLQNMNCAFVQEKLKNYEDRLDTFPQGE